MNVTVSSIPMKGKEEGSIACMKALIFFIRLMLHPSGRHLCSYNTDSTITGLAGVSIATEFSIGTPTHTHTLHNRSEFCVGSGSGSQLRGGEL